VISTSPCHSAVLVHSETRSCTPEQDRSLWWCEHPRLSTTRASASGCCPCRLPSSRGMGTCQRIWLIGAAPRHLNAIDTTMPASACQCLVGVDLHGPLKHCYDTVMQDQPTRRMAGSCPEIPVRPLKDFYLGLIYSMEYTLRTSHSTISNHLVSLCRGESIP
jgi:hypothetical protein